MTEVVSFIGYIEIIGIVFSLLFLTAQGAFHIRDIHKNKKIKAERKECFLMISHSSRFLYFGEDNAYLTDIDFAFLKHKIYKNWNGFIICG